MTFLVKKHREPNEDILIKADLGSLASIIPAWFHRIEIQQHLCSDVVWRPCWLNQSKAIMEATYILLPSTFAILDAVILHYTWWIIFLPIFFALIWIILLTIRVKPTLKVRNIFRCSLIITYWLMAMNTSIYSSFYFGEHLLLLLFFVDNHLQRMFLAKVIVLIRQMQAHHHVESLTQMFWQSLPYLKCHQQLSSAWIEH